MIAEIGLALGVSLVGMIAVGTIVKQWLGLRSAINWFCQTAVLFGAATILSVGGIATAIMLAFPTVIHLLRFALLKRVEHKAKNGGYGNEAQWAYELVVEDEDQQFLHAQTALPQSEVMEVSVIAESKQELRDLMIERYNEVASEDISTNAAN